MDRRCSTALIWTRCRFTKKNETDYVSRTDGVMHACAHDGHTAIALGIAKLLSNHREALSGRVKFVFQPAEEQGRGAEYMIEDGALESPAPDYCLGIHLWNDLEVGDVSVVSGPTMSGAGLLKSLSLAWAVTGRCRIKPPIRSFARRRSSSRCKPSSAAMSIRSIW